MYCMRRGINQLNLRLPTNQYGRPRNSVSENTNFAISAGPIHERYSVSWFIIAFKIVKIKLDLELDLTTKLPPEILDLAVWIYTSVIPPGWGMICDGVNCYIRKCTIYYPWLWLLINIVVISYWRWRDWFHSNLNNNCECALIIKDNRWYIYGM